MRLTVNGKETIVDQALTIYCFLEQKGIIPASVVVEYNREIPEREKWKDILLKDGDELEIIKFMGGG
jgi:sulfur carrier protein